MIAPLPTRTSRISRFIMDITGWIIITDTCQHRMQEVLMAVTTAADLIPVREASAAETAAVAATVIE